MGVHYCAYTGKMGSPNGGGINRGLEMAIYGLTMLPLSKYLLQVVPECHQPWYADNAGAGGKFDKIADCFMELTDKGPVRGYFPNPTKSILVVKPHSVKVAKAKFSHLGFHVVNGTQYLGGHVKTVESKEEWVSDKVKSRQVEFKPMPRPPDPPPTAPSLTSRNCCIVNGFT